MAYPYQSYQGNGMYQQGGFYNQPQFQQIQPQAPQFGFNQPMQSNQPVMQNGLIWVDGINDVNQFPVAPNNTVRLWNKNGRIVYFKTADASGKPAIEAYDLVKRETLDDSETEKQTEYALKSDLASFASAVSAINQIVTSVQKDVETIKGDMYGVVGKKKPTKKPMTEDGEDE